MCEDLKAEKGFLFLFLTVDSFFSFLKSNLFQYIIHHHACHLQLLLKLDTEKMKQPETCKV